MPPSSISWLPSGGADHCAPRHQHHAFFLGQVRGVDDGYYGRWLH
ncbi:hypothetical protein [Streptomyces sp. NBC_00401]|nr:hypothetical protein [Streptomyces sp. NBC_00401]MCX5083987.1 hypothetical protein [Streptomyces sp. NBC_00401]